MKLRDCLKRLKVFIKAGLSLAFLIRVHSSWLPGRAWLHLHSWLHRHAWLRGHSWLHRHAWLHLHSWLHGHAWLHRSPRVSHHRSSSGLSHHLRRQSSLWHYLCHSRIHGHWRGHEWNIACRQNNWNHRHGLDLRCESLRRLEPAGWVRDWNNL